MGQNQKQGEGRLSNTGQGRFTREQIGRWNHNMTALRFLTGGRHQNIPTSLRTLAE